MTDVYVNLAQAEPLVIEQLSQRLELRAADPKQQAMLHAYLTEVPFPDGARVLEVGCGSGAIARTLARWPKVGSVHGIDPSPGLLDRARELAAGISNLDFELGDGRDLPLASESFDVVVFHTCLCHVPGPERALREAHRVLRTGGWMAIFDGDYVTTTVATGPHDPLQACIEAAVDGLVNDPWLARRLPGLVGSAGFDVWEFQSHSYVQTLDPTYMQSLVERGAESLLTAGRIGDDLAGALKNEGRRRAQAGTFFGHIAYGSLVARKRD